MGLVWPPKIKILYLSKVKSKNMNPMLIIGWLFLLATWLPKPFIKDEAKLIRLNLVLSGVATGIFIVGILSMFFL